MSTVELLKHQSGFLKAKEKFVLLSGGIGSGKSWAGSHYAISKAFKEPNGQGLICANTYKQLTNSTLACLFRELDQLEIPFKYVQNRGYLQIGNCKILCLSLENYDYIRGIEISWFWADEVRDTKLEAFQVLMGRLRDKRSRLEGRLTSSPSGFNWLYDYFAGEKKTKDYKLINADSRANPFLPEDYVSTLMDGYDPKLIEQEIGGKFVNVSSGQVYYAFDRKKHVAEFPLKHTPKKIGCDFNVNPITAVQVYYENDIIYIYDEHYKNNSNTYELADDIKAKWGICDVYPDATGKARKSSATRTDHQILTDNGFDVQYNPNPHVKDRYNCFNGLLYHDRIVIHPRCKMLIKDLEQFTHENKDDMLSHISDAAGYLIWGLAPLKPKRQASRTLSF